MRKKDLSLYRKKEIKDLRNILESKQKDSKETYVKIRSGQEKNIKAFKSLRLEIAQILTIIREKEIIASSDPVFVKEDQAKNKTN